MPPWGSRLWGQVHTVWAETMLVPGDVQHNKGEGKGKAAVRRKQVPKEHPDFLDVLCHPAPFPLKNPGEKEDGRGCGGSLDPLAEVGNQ